MITARSCRILAAVNGFLAVAAGAFAAHGLKEKLTPDMLAVFETAARYQMYHALALLLTAILIQQRPARSLTIAAWSFAIGIILFSGSLYALALTQIKILGAITPLGGIAFLTGWLALALCACSKSK